MKVQSVSTEVSSRIVVGTLCVAVALIAMLAPASASAELIVPTKSNPSVVVPHVEQNAAPSPSPAPTPVYGPSAGPSSAVGADNDSAPQADPGSSCPEETCSGSTGEPGGGSGPGDSPIGNFRGCEEGIGCSYQSDLPEASSSSALAIFFLLAPPAVILGGMLGDGSDGSNSSDIPVGPRMTDSGCPYMTYEVLVNLLEDGGDNGSNACF